MSKANLKQAQEGQPASSRPRDNATTLFEGEVN